LGQVQQAIRALVVRLALSDMIDFKNLAPFVRLEPLPATQHNRVLHVCPEQLNQMLAKLHAIFAVLGLLLLTMVRSLVSHAILESL
jgi:hypothetical protein